MKICFLSADRGISFEKHNGAAAQVRCLIRSFRKIGHEVSVITPSGGGEDLGIPIFRISTPQVLDRLLGRFTNGRPGQSDRDAKRMAHALGHIWNNVMVEQSLIQILKESKPDLVFEVYSPYGIAAGILATEMGFRHMLNVHAPLAWEGKQYRQQALQEAADAMEQIAFDSAQLIVTNSKELRQQLIETGISPGKIVAVANGVDTEMFSPLEEQDATGQPEEIVIGFVGSLKAWHGIDLLIEAFRRLAEDPRLKLLVVGDGPMAKPLKKLSEEFDGRITLPGAVPLERVPSYVQSMDIAVAPYPPLDRFYFSPLKVLEYMAAGKAMVASDIGQIADIVRDGQTGILVPPGNVSALVDAVRNLADDHDLRRRIGAHAAAEVRRNHTWDQRASDIIRLAQAMPQP